MPPRLPLSRRDALRAGLAVAGGVLLPACSRPSELPPTYGHLLRMGDNLTYLAHRTLLPGQTMVREYAKSDISSFPAIGTTSPDGELFARLQHAAFADYRISVEGRVSRPGTYSLADLRNFPSRTQITRHMCEEGWSAIAEWTGVALGRVLAAAGTLPSARFVQFATFDGWGDGLDMVDALHPQTLLAYGMNGKPLPVPHGGPLRLRVETQLGYKSLKFLTRINVTDTFDDHGKSGSIQNGWSWYAGI